MTQEDKQLLLKDLCARLPYGVVLDTGTQLRSIDNLTQIISGFGTDKKIENTKYYLRPISSMTEEEAKQLNSILPCSMSFTYTTGEELIIYTDSEYDGDHYFGCFVDIEDWLNAHYFDYRGLIEKGLALKAKEGMYNG